MQTICAIILGKMAVTGVARLFAKQYRSPSDATTGYPVGVRAQAAEALEKFAEERCIVTHTDAR